MGGAGTTPQRGAWRLSGAALLSCLLAAPVGRAQTAFETSIKLAQNAPDNPAATGVPGESPFANPFPATPGAPETPNFQYQTNLEPAMGALPSVGWTIVPRISAYEEFNDNILQSQNDRRYDFITLLAPGIAITGDTPRITLRLNYNPIFRIYARTSSQDSVSQQALGVADATLIPDEFYVRARLFADEVPANGGFGNLNFGAPTIGSTGFGALGGSASTLSRNNLSQVESSELFPYVVHRFGDAGTGRVGINLTQNYSSSSAGALLNSPTGPAQHSETAEAIAQFTSGEGLGRFVDIATLDGAVTGGTGVQANATRAIGDNRLGYAITRAIMVFGDLGAETIQYPNAAPPVHITDGVWGLGTLLRPNEDSEFTLEYGHLDGITSFRGIARYSMTPRTVFTASYTSGITTDLQQIEDQVSNTTVSPAGNPVNLDTGAPVSLVNYLTGINTSVNRTNTLVVTATALLDRDTISVGLERQNETPIASARGVTPTVPNTTLSANASERHEISERMSLTAAVQGGTRTLQSGSTNQDEQWYSATVSLRYLFSDKLTGYAQYSYFDRVSNTPGVPYYNNIVLVGITRTF
jgi:uncharacterized protein (PEP-CTERM system associated)